MSSVVSWSRSVWSALYSGALKGRLARFSAKALEYGALQTLREVLCSTFHRPLDRDRHRAINVRRAEFLEGEFASDLFHDGDAEVGFIARRVIYLAIGFVNAHE